MKLLADYQERLAAQDTHGVLVCLQALDAAGKDGTIRHVTSGVNPQGVHVSSFKEPSAEELSHDFLWRYAQRLPARGEIGIFNRSHYEEVLVVRVHRAARPREAPEGRERQGASGSPGPAPSARICVSAVLAHTLVELDPQYPKLSPAQQREERKAKAELLAQAPEGATADPFQASSTTAGKQVAKEHAKHTNGKRSRKS